MSPSLKEKRSFSEKGGWAVPSFCHLGRWGSSEPWSEIFCLVFVPCHVGTLWQQGQASFPAGKKQKFGKRRRAGPVAPSHRWWN